MNSKVGIQQYIQATYETLYMTCITMVIAVFFGILIATTLYVTRKKGLFENKIVNVCLNTVVNIVRSLPFIILLFAIIPFTRLVVGTAIGTEATIVPLVMYSAPYIGRLIESALLEVDNGVIEAGKSVAATRLRIIACFVYPEALPAIMNNLTIATIGVIGATAMAGTVGGGGLGYLALAYGYQRFNGEVMLVTVILLIMIVQIIQFSGNQISRKLDHTK